MVEEFTVRRTLVVEALRAIPGIRCAWPRGAFYAFPEVTGTGLDGKTMADRLLDEAGVKPEGRWLLAEGSDAAGMSRSETSEAVDLIRKVTEGRSLVMVEHDMKLVMGISDRIYVVNQGTPLAQGTPAEIRNNPDVIRAYLGEE